MTKRLFVLSIALTFLFAACQKDTTEPANMDVLNASCEGSVAKLSLWKQLDFAENNPSGFTVYSASALFSDAVLDVQNQSQTLLDVGQVAFEGIAMQKGTSNGRTIYLYVDSTGNTSGQITWDIEGGNAYPNINHETSNSLPTFEVSFDNSNITTTEDLTINFDNLKEADSIKVLINFQPYTTIAASSSLTLTAAELSNLNLPNGNVLVNVIAFSRTSRSYDGKELCFTLESERRTNFTRQ